MTTTDRNQAPLAKIAPKKTRKPTQPKIRRVPPEPILHTVPEFAVMSRISERFAWELVLSGQLQSVKIGSRRLLRRSDIERFVDSHVA